MPILGESHTLLKYGLQQGLLKILHRPTKKKINNAETSHKDYNGFESLGFMQGSFFLP